MKTGMTGCYVTLWLIWICIGITAIESNRLVGQVAFLAAVCLFGCWLKFTYYDKPQGRKKSIEMGLEVIDLLPLHVYWAKFLVRGKLQGNVKNAYEIHLRIQRLSPKKLIRGMEKDLEYIEANMQGLFLWQTNVAVPRKIRNIIKRYENDGLAFWEKGSFPVPQSPSTLIRRSKKPTRHGAILIGGVEKLKYEQEIDDCNINRTGADFYPGNNIHSKQRT